MVQKNTVSKGSPLVLQMGMEEKLIRNGAKADKVYSLPWLGLYTASMPVLPAAAAAAAAEPVL